MQSIEFATIPFPQATTSLTQHAASADDFFARLKACPVGDKHEEAIILAKFAPCPTPCRNDGRGPASKKCGGNRLHKLSANATHATGIGLDLDDLTPASEAALKSWLASTGLESFAWQTHSHTTEAPRWRVLIFFTAPIPCSNSSWKVIFKAVWAHLGLETVLGAKYDPATVDLGRNFYAPRRPTEEDAREVLYIAGSRLDVSDVKVTKDKAPPVRSVDLDEDSSEPSAASPELLQAVHDHVTAKYEPKSKGHGRELNTTSWCIELVQECALNRADAWSLALDLNETLCDPPYSDDDLERKLDFARDLKRTDEQDYAARDWFDVYGQVRARIEGELAAVAAAMVPAQSSLLITAEQLSRVHNRLVKGARRLRRLRTDALCVIRGEAPQGVNARKAVSRVFEILGEAMVREGIPTTAADLVAEALGLARAVRALNAPLVGDTVTRE